MTNILLTNPEFKELGDYVTDKIKGLAKTTGFSEHALTNGLSDFILGEEYRKFGRERVWRARVRLYHNLPGQRPVV